MMAAFDYGVTKAPGYLNYTIPNACLMNPTPDHAAMKFGPNFHLM
jgi:hypothetical protein